MGAGGCVTASYAAVKRAETLCLFHITHQRLHQGNLLKGLTQERERSLGEWGLRGRSMICIQP